MLRDGVATHRFHEPEEILVAVPGVFFQAVPFGRGPFEVLMTTLALGNITLQVGHCTPLMGFAKAASDRAVLLLPLDGVESLVMNGVQGQPRVVRAYGGGAEHLRTSPRDSTYSTLTLPVEAAVVLLAPPARSRLFRPGSQVLLPATPDTWVRATGIIRAAAESAAATPETFDAEQPRLALREALLHAARDLISGAEEDAPVWVPRSSGARKRIVVAADDYLRAHIDRPIYTDELCDALGVSASSLVEAFHAVFVISPHRFLKLRRLSMVRAALRSREGARPLVKSVALSHGFWHQGQFAHDYRANFGESPSETLARARGWAAIEDLTGV
jgi:AraC family transcriptional regulator, ethanolamine operon transcriptional activator